MYDDMKPWKEQIFREQLLILLLNESFQMETGKYCIYSIYCY